MKDKSEDTLYDLLHMDMWAIEIGLKNLTGNEAEFNTISYHIQQALEKCIKFQLEMEGVKYGFTHDLNVLLEYSESIKAKMPVDLWLELGMITMWEDRTRNVKGYRTPYPDILGVYPLVRKYIQDVGMEYAEFLKDGDDIRESVAMIWPYSTVEQE